MRELKAKKVCLICVNYISTWALFGFFQASLQRDGNISFLVYNYMQDPFNCKNCSDPSDLRWPQTPDTQLSDCVFLLVMLDYLQMLFGTTYVSPRRTEFCGSS